MIEGSEIRLNGDVLGTIADLPEGAFVTIDGRLQGDSIVAEGVWFSNRFAATLTLIRDGATTDACWAVDASLPPGCGEGIPVTDVDWLQFPDADRAS